MIRTLLLLASTAAADWNYAQHGADWAAAYPACISSASALQSPIDIPQMRQHAPAALTQPMLQENRASECGANAVMKGMDFGGGDLTQVR